jgi:WD40 repeat protein
MEDWAVLKRCRGHRGTISDVAWSPDSLHFASCSTDSTICIWDVNEHAPVQILDAKANGLTFDPFGKFFASQSSEDKKLTIWRIQNFKNITRECEREVYYRSGF